MTDLFRFNSAMLLKGSEPVVGEGGKLLGKIGGIMSTNASDFQGDILEQDGVDWSYFAENGIFNYNHRPGTVIGEPTKVIRKGNRTLVEGHLYLTNPLGEQIYSQAQAIRKAGGRWSYGFSVEGSVIERDKDNPNRILKAKVMNVSVCEHPVNPEARMHLIKSMDVGYQAAAEMTGGEYSPMIPQSMDGAVSFADFKSRLKKIYPRLTDSECDRVARSLYQGAQ